MTIDLHTPTAVQRLLKYYASADDDALHYGLSWYERAHRIAADIARRTTLSTRQAAGIIAALSPRNPWKRNVEMARAIAYGQDVRGMSRPIAKARRILNGEDWNDVLNGPKERAFADNISDPWTSTAWTGDVWATRALFPPDTPPADVERWFKRVGSYDRGQHCYQLAAKRVGVPTHVFQAVVWCVVRGSHD